MKQWLLPVLLVLVAGCDSGDNSTPVAPTTAPQSRLGLEVTSIAPLNARRHTHVTIDSRGNVYWVQENEGGDDLVFGFNEGGVPEPVPQLTSRRMLDMLRVVGGTGNIQAMVVGPDDELYLYFVGGKGRTLLAGLVQYSPRAKTLRLLADTDQIMADSGMGKSLDLARGSLVASSTDLWLWLRHTDGYVVLRVVTSTSLARPTELRQPFTTVRVLAKAANAPPQTLTPKPGEIKLTSETEDLAAGDNQKLFYIDRLQGILWVIDGKGIATVCRPLQGWSEQMTPPILDKSGRLHLFLGDGERINVLDSGGENTQLVNGGYPALLTFDGIKPTDKLTVIPRQEIKPATNVHLESVQPTVWAVDPVAGGFVAYDTASGELLRLKETRR